MFCQHHRGRTFCVFSSRFSDTPCCNNRLSDSWNTSSVPLVQYRTLNIAISTLLSRIRVDVANCLVSDIPWSSNTPLCICNTRNSCKFRLPFCRTRTKQFSVFYQGPKFYNTLNTNIINASSPFSFKRALKAFICNNY